MTWRLCDADWNHWPDGLHDAAVWAAAARAGFEGVEVGVYRAADELAPERVEERRRLARHHALPVAMLLLSLPASRWPAGALSSPAAASRVATEARATAEVAADLGLATIGVWPGADPASARWEDVVKGAELVADAVAPTGVRVAMEYKPGTALGTAGAALCLCDAVPALGVLLDTGHAFAAGEDPAEVVGRLGDRLWHVHLGDAAPGAADDDLPVGRLHDFGPVTAALDAASYGGAASLDLYGAVSAGLITGVDAAVESRSHLLATRS
ncbi:MAG TPA: TIM barrel protein [Acidimicrobiales bacterium]|nr:TIM barrel protein [Acidimicrobiales bacterium]